MPVEIRLLAGDAAQKLSAFVQGQIQGTTEDYKLLEDLNGATSERYTQMGLVVDSVATHLEGMKQKCKDGDGAVV